MVVCACVCERGAVEYWRHKYEREGKTRRAFEESLQALAMEQGIMEKQGPSRDPPPVALPFADALTRSHASPPRTPMQRHG